MRDGCHLCEEAAAAFEEIRPQVAPFELELVDIEVDPKLHARMLERIPVAEVSGRTIFELFFDRDAVLEALGPAATV